MKPGPKPVRDSVRFAAYTRLAPSGCLEWTGSRGTTGYGQFYFQGRPSVKAHRAAWVMAFGPIPDGMYVLHRCDNRTCVEPSHLFLGTHADNMADMSSKGRASSGPGLRGSTIGNSTLHESDVVRMRQLRAAGWTYKELAAEFATSLSNAHLICMRKHWKHVA